MRHNFKEGDLVWWTMGAGKPLPFNDKELFIGIVVRVAEQREGVEVYWFNNDLFKVINCEGLMKADIKIPEKRLDNRAKKTQNVV